MLKKAFEWYRAVNLQPASGVLDNRIAAVKDLLSSIEEAEDYELVLHCVAGVVGGFEKRFSQDHPLVTALISAIKEYDLAVPEDIKENALELRVTAALALGEGIQEAEDNTWGLAAAMLLISAGLPRALPRGRYLNEMLQELITLADETLKRNSNAARVRNTAPLRLLLALEDVEIPDHATLVQKMIPKIKGALEESDRQAQIDREESNVLWWLFGGVSTIAKKPFSRLSDGAAALCAGIEVGEMLLVPPVSSAEPIVQRAAELGRETATTDRGVEAFVADWEAEHLMAAFTKKFEEFVKANPVAFPLHWLGYRLTSTADSKAWITPFEHATGMSRSFRQTSVGWAVQLMHERVTLRKFV